MATESVAERDEFTLVSQLSTPEYILDVKFSDGNIEPERFAEISAKLSDAASDLLNVSRGVSWDAGVPSPDNIDYGVEFLIRCSSLFSRLSIAAETQRKGV